MIQFKRGMMVFRQVEQTTDQSWGQTAQQRVVLTTRINQQQDETRERQFRKGMMVGTTARERY